MLLTNSKKPKIINGIPIGAANNVIVRIAPTIINTSPKIAAINLPVMFRIKASRSQIALNGHRYQGVLFWLFALILRLLYRQTVLSLFMVLTN